MLPICSSCKMIVLQSLSLRFAEPAPFAQGSLFLFGAYATALLLGEPFIVGASRQFPLLGRLLNPILLFLLIQIGLQDQRGRKLVHCFLALLSPHIDFR